jgi:hypothetical protein
VNRAAEPKRRPGVGCSDLLGHIMIVWLYDYAEDDASDKLPRSPMADSEQNTPQG